MKSAVAVLLLAVGLGLSHGTARAGQEVLPYYRPPIDLRLEVLLCDTPQKDLGLSEDNISDIAKLRADRLRVQGKIDYRRATLLTTHEAFREEVAKEYDRIDPVLAKILTPHQLERVNQISILLWREQVLHEPRVRGALKLSADQETKIGARIRDAVMTAPDCKPEDSREASDKTWFAHWRESFKGILDHVLTAEQRGRWALLVGKPYAHLEETFIELTRIESQVELDSRRK